MEEILSDVIQKIEKLEKLNLCELTIHEIRLQFQSFSIPFYTFPQVPPARIFRGQVCSDQPFDKIARLSYNPNPSQKIGRSSLTNETVFYASSSMDNAAIEACQDQIKDGRRDFYVTVGEWLLKKNIEINIICHSQKALQIGTDLSIAANAVKPYMRKDNTEDQYKVLLLKSEFFADQFAKSDIKCQNDYAFSAIYSSEALQKAKVPCDGICYPSVAYRLKGFNVAYKKELFDNETFEFVGAYFVRIIFEDFEKYPKFKKLRTSLNFENGIIKW